MANRDIPLIRYAGNVPEQIAVIAIDVDPQTLPNFLPAHEKFFTADSFKATIIPKAEVLLHDQDPPECTEPTSFLLPVAERLENRTYLVGSAGSKGNLVVVCSGPAFDNDHDYNARTARLRKDSSGSPLLYDHKDHIQLPQNPVQVTVNNCGNSVAIRCFRSGNNLGHDLRALARRRIEEPDYIVRLAEDPDNVPDVQDIGYGDQGLSPSFLSICMTLGTASKGFFVCNTAFT